MITKLIKPLIDEAYNKGFSAGVSAEKLKEKKELTDRESFLYTYGYNQGKADAEAEHGIIEISAEEFDNLTNSPKTEIPEGFGFVGTIDDIGLVLDEAN